MYWIRELTKIFNTFARTKKKNPYTEVMANIIDKKSLEIVKTRTLFLKENELSNEIVLTGDIEDMYFTVSLHYIANAVKGHTHIEIMDAYHANFSIETTPSSITKLVSPHKIGVYKNRNLYFDFVVQPQEADKTHNVTLTFYTEKQ